MKFFYRQLFVVFLLLGFAFNAKAVNDTLTRGQVYDFSVGDTFDYYTLLYYTQVAPPPNMYLIERFVYESRIDDTIQRKITYKGKRHNKRETWSQVGPNMWQPNITTWTDTFTTIIASTDYFCFATNCNYCHTDFCSTDSSLFASPDAQGRSLTLDTFLGHEGIVSSINSFSFIGQTAVYRRVGMTVSGESYEDGSPPQNYHLIYCHLASGEVWGAPGNFLLGIDNLSTDLTFHLSPNPTTEQLTITADNQTPVTVSIYSATGVLMGSFQKPAAGALTVPVNNLPPAYYLLKLSGSDGLSATKGFIKQP